MTKSEKEQEPPNNFQYYHSVLINTNKKTLPGLNTFALKRNNKRETILEFYFICLMKHGYLNDVGTNAINQQEMATDICI